jgi:hypothetical protein
MFIFLIADFGLKNNTQLLFNPHSAMREAAGVFAPAASLIYQAAKRRVGRFQAFQDCRITLL